MIWLERARCYLTGHVPELGNRHYRWIATNVWFLYYATSTPTGRCRFCLQPLAQGTLLPSQRSSKRTRASQVRPR